ncbi:hydroxymethylbilane synthase [Anaerovorax sp. IOR16]|uniref:hydroxymethylbilane synthase n=1 Tax=Anaerovorax sp. IOR16 TaxID=2773458 RepID=UPI0019D062CE|nr:hydroxymethylbilane synthase [Anaerovorax sp. IOR16]
MERRKIRIGSRESKLAVIQSQMVMDLIHQHHPEIELELVTMKTTGDIILDKTLDKIGGKGLFVKELDKALLEGKIDLSVHSLKDMPMEVPETIPLVGFSKRENPVDALVLPKGVTEVNPSKPIGSSSRRRNLQLAELYPEHETKSVRGNVITRLSKLDNGEFGALILAYAGLERLGLSDRVSRAFSPEEMIPAAGQGILAIQGRAGENYDFLDCVRDENAEFEALAERAFVRYLDGGCSSPIGAFAHVIDSEIKIRGLYYNEESGQYRIGETAGVKEDGEKLAVALAKRLKEEESTWTRK